MIGKIFLNILYNMAIILLLMSLVWSFNHGRYDLLAGAVPCLAVVIFLKIRLRKQVRELLKR